MNTIYKSKWSEATQTWVACSELVRGKTKNNHVKIAVAIALALTSISSYASCATAGNNPDILAEKDEVCNLNENSYNSISADGATLNGNSINANGSNANNQKNKTINISNSSLLTADNVTATNAISGTFETNALAIDSGSTVDINNNLEATNTGKNTTVIKLSNGATLKVGNEITVNNTAKFVGDGIENDSSTILANKITIFANNATGGTSAINNKGGEIHATDIVINQNNSNYAIQQTSANSGKTSLIDVKNKLNIKAGEISDGNAAINVEAGSISVAGQTTIEMEKNFDDVENIKSAKPNQDVSAIFVSNNGEYKALGGAEIKIRNSESKKYYTEIKGVILGNNGTFINNGDLKVNENQSTVIATDSRLSANVNVQATFVNQPNGTTTSDTDTILHKSNGILNINNEGTLSSTNITSGSVLTNKGTGTIVVKNFDGGTLSGNINNENDGTITLNNKGNGNVVSNIYNRSTGTGTITINNYGSFTGITKNSDSGIIKLDNQGTWNNTGNSVLTDLKNTTGIIKFPQISEINAGYEDQYHTITVNGNYTGGGLMYVNTVWNKDGTSYSDRVDIHGDVDGAATTVRTLNGIYGDVTLKEIPIHSAVVVHVAGKSSGNDFTGSAPTTNAGEAQLKKIDTTSGTDYAWTLTAQNKIPEPTNPGVSGSTDPNVSGPAAPDKPILPAPPITEVPIYAEPVSGYVQMPTADMELGFTTIGTLHERRGENQTYNITGSNNTALGDDQQQTWGRVLVKHLNKDGKKRLDTAGNQSVLQIGHDFILDENEKTGTRRHIGGYVAYGHNENDFRDQYHAKNGYIVDDHYTGKGRTDAISVGGYGTFYGNNGGYVDLVGQVTYLRNKYNARSNESVHQNGWGAALSAETGKSFIVYGNNWFVEPQAQLVYQYLSLDDFNDRIRHVDQHDPSALRGRVGMRFGYNGDIRDNLPPSSFYGIANIWHDFVNPKSVDIGRDSLKEEYAKTWGEVGLGIQLPITHQSNFYSDIRYEKNFGSDKRKGFKGTMGYKYTWL
ncbi:autotransporter outer membrane beta-barrel domain-containing protein [Snodgrassella alvi]|uniref:autotransporter outer membrane beta-barrel domain-containing protein n=1 Tax=Snodgrassella alvi TaxID=1196083 RepID=UPI003D03DDD2